MNDGIHYTKLEAKEGRQAVVKYMITEENAKGEVIFETADLTFNGQTIQFDDYFFNNDETKALLTTNTAAIYRRSYTAVYYLFDIKTKKLSLLDEQHQPQTLAEYSPDGKKVSYIHKNNLYVKDLASGKVTQLTNDGKRNKIINGTTDWVYEEEFGITKAYGWSPDSKHIAFLRFDEKEVKEFTMMYYEELYPEKYTFKYPKAGEANSKVSAHIVNTANGKITALNLGEYEYIPRLQWSGTKNQLVIQTLNRHQNALKYHLIDLTGKKMSQKVFFEETSKTYVEIDDNLLILKDGNTILRTSEADGFNRIYKLSFDGTNTKITTGGDVIEFYGIDETIGKIYYAEAGKGVYGPNS
jgi:dipeptidyl-peptidase-4